MKQKQKTKNKHVLERRVTMSGIKTNQTLHSHGFFFKILKNLSHIYFLYLAWDRSAHDS